MAIPINDLPGMLAYIASNYEQAHTYAEDWHTFSHEHPEVELTDNFSAFLQWADTWARDHDRYDTEHLERLWRSREIAESFQYIEHEAHEHAASHPEQGPQATQVTGTIINGIAFTRDMLLKKPDTIEDAKEFKQVEKEVMQEWLKNNPGKGTKNLEWLDFVHGSLDSSVSQTAKATALERLYKKYADDPKKIQYFDELRKRALTQEHDSGAYRREKTMEKVAKQRYEALQKAGVAKTYDEVLFRTKQNAWDQYVQLYPQVAEKKAATYVGIKTALARRDLARLSQKSTGAPTARQQRIAQLQQKRDARDLKNDPTLLRINKEINQYATSLVARKQSAGIRANYADIRKQVAQERWDAFVKTNLADAKRLVTVDKDLQEALTRKTIVDAKQQNRPIPPPRRKQDDQEQQQQQRLSAQQIQQQIRQIQQIQQRAQQVSNVTRNVGNQVGGAARRVGSRVASTAGRAAARAGAQAGRMAATAAAEGLAATAPAWVPIAIAIGVILLVLIFLFLILYMVGAVPHTDVPSTPGSTTSAVSTEPVVSIPGLTLSIEGEDAIANGGQIHYTITAIYSGSDELVVYTTLPSVLDAKSHSPKPDVEGQRLTWTLSKYTPEVTPEGKKYVFTLVVQPTVPDTTITTIVYAKNLTDSASGSTASLFPDTSDAPGSESQKQFAIDTFTKNKDVLFAAYKEAERQTGVRWHILAGMHMREGSAAPNTSIASGRVIGTLEPDSASTQGCVGNPVGVDDGKAEPLAGGGCKFNSLLDSAIWGANHLKGKIGGKVPTTYEDLVTAASRYNGGGNANCGRNVPYNGCPKLFYGEDDPYAVDLLDAKHSPMYVIYCGDGRVCSTLTPDTRPGVVTTARWVANTFKE